MDDFRRRIVSEEGCFATTFERRYYKKTDIFVKRSLRESEYRTGYRGLHIPKLGKERLRNEVASLDFIHKITNVPVPQLYDHFEYNGASYVALEYVEGANMADLCENQKKAVNSEIDTHLITMHNLTSSKIGGPSGIIIPPYRILGKIEDQMWNPPTKDCAYIFCHMDLSQHNIIEDSVTLKIKTIIGSNTRAFGLCNLSAVFI
ncbi:hypothetical protein BPAE_0026g00350 [Botrytis paeoniae]|uniref:Protein kinase domain-containing protein n=1 Tax=Botrytis paeoniae TaxID=278948 RepID=A0A4Z1FVI2_9HELO|nr:hypothetical protein BPAE_0026g00350 [Botrytis paeoniae]